jgi:biopolymer transport protein ExbB/TolQ
MRTTASAAGSPFAMPAIPGLPYLVAILLAGVFIALGTYGLEKNSILAVFLFDHSDKSFFARVYPFNIQNAMYVMMAVGLADLWVRHANTQREHRYLNMHLLPEKDTDILQVDDLGAIRRKVADLHAPEDAFLPTLIDLSILQLFTSRSLEQTVDIYTSTLELISHRLDLAYQTMRFLVWVIPTTGFIGTVVGISIALEGMQDPKNIEFEKVTSGLAVAF